MQKTAMVPSTIKDSTQLNREKEIFKLREELQELQKKIKQVKQKILNEIKEGD